jgi:hypothetical protein
MKDTKFLYTDGRGVVVTDSEFQVHKNHYRLNGITKFGLSVIRPNKLPAVILAGIGVLLFMTGKFELVPQSMLDSMKISNVGAFNETLIIAGAIFTLLGLVLIILLRERYAVRIATAEGDKNAVVSTKKEYIKQIVDALGKAVNYNFKYNKLEQTL